MKATSIWLIVLACLVIAPIGISLLFPKLAVKLKLLYPDDPEDNITGLSDDVVILRYGAAPMPRLHCSQCGARMESHITRVIRHPSLGLHSRVTGKEKESVQIVAQYECPNDKGMTWATNGHNFLASTWPNADNAYQRQWFGTWEPLPRSPWFELGTSRPDMGGR